MLGRVVEGVAHPDALENQFRRLADDLGVARLTAAESARVDVSEPLAEHLGEDLGRIEQESLPTPSRIMGEALPPSLIAFCRRCLIQQDARAPNPYSHGIGKDGADVLLVDKVAEHVKSCRTQGLSIEAPRRHVHAGNPAEGVESVFRRAVLTVKAQHTEEALAPHLVDYGYVALGPERSQRPL